MMLKSYNPDNQSIHFSAIEVAHSMSTDAVIAAEQNKNLRHGITIPMIIIGLCAALTATFTIGI